jgi:hypothetical protein
MNTEIGLISSAGIRAFLKATGDDCARKAGTYDHPLYPGNSDARVVIWELPSGAFALATNGFALHQWQHEREFLLAMDEYQLMPEVLRAAAGSLMP